MRVSQLSACCACSHELPTRGSTRISVCRRSPPVPSKSTSGAASSVGLQSWSTGTRSGLAPCVSSTPPVLARAAAACGGMPAAAASALMPQRTRLWQHCCSRRRTAPSRPAQAVLAIWQRRLLGTAWTWRCLMRQQPMRMMHLAASAWWGDKPVCSSHSATASVSHTTPRQPKAAPAVAALRALDAAGNPGPGALCYGA